MSYNRNEIIQKSLELVNETDIFPKEALQWLLTVFNRQEPSQDGIQQLAPLLDLCQQYNQQKAQLLPHQNYLGQSKVTSMYEHLKANFYLQRRILVCVASRKQLYDINIRFRPTSGD